MKQPDRVDLVRTVCGQEIRFRTHQRPDLDEIYGAHLIARHATPEFLVRYAKDGVILLGVDGGDFDEHARNGGERRADCSATLVAEALGLADDPVTVHVLEIVAESDREKIRAGKEVAKRDCSRIVKLLHRANPDQPEVAARWATMALEAIEAEQRQLLTETKAEFGRCSSSVFVDVPGCRQLVITTVRSDDEQMNAFARSKLGSRADVVIQRNSDGHTQIHCRISREFGHGFFAPKLRDLVGLLRITEAREKGVSIAQFGDGLKADGAFDLVPEWYFMEVGPTILNGSLKHRASVPATRLTLEEIEISTVIALDVRTFESEREEQCRKGVCISTGASPCSWVNWRLTRCCVIRQRRPASAPRVVHAKVEVSGRKGVSEVKA